MDLLFLCNSIFDSHSPFLYNVNPYRRSHFRLKFYMRIKIIFLGHPAEVILIFCCWWIVFWPVFERWVIMTNSKYNQFINHTWIQLKRKTIQMTGDISLTAGIRIWQPNASNIFIPFVNNDILKAQFCFQFNRCTYTTKSIRI